MTFWDALMWAGIGVGGLLAFLGLFFWTMDAWFDGEWWERIATVLVWIVVLAGVILAFSQVAVPA